MVDPALRAVVKEVDTRLTRAASRFEPGVHVHEEGRVLRAEDGVAHVSGLQHVTLDELVIVDDGEPGMVMGLNAETVQVVLLGNLRKVHEGSRVRRSERQVSIEVGDSVLGRVLDPLGKPLDGQPLTGALTPMVLHRRAPQIYDRAAISRPLLTGILAIDAMFPIGRGQRELIVGDEGTGKTSLALDIMLRQHNTGVVSIYVAIGRRRSELARITRTLLNKAGEFVVVAAPEDLSVGLRYLAPYAGCAIAEYFMARGRDVVIIYDELTAHAVAFRELSLLMRRPPGREAYPGDIFYQHSRLLERATQMSPDAGGGSMTALPIATLEGGRLSAYIPTNLISITDGQIVLSHALFSAGQKPAIDAGLSVSRVGSQAQCQAISGLARRLRLDFASFLELESFARLGTRLDRAAERRIQWGKRVRRLLRAPRLKPQSLFEEVVRLLLASEHDLLETINEDQLSEVAERLCQQLRVQSSSVADRVEHEGVLPDRDRKTLVEALRRRVAPLAKTTDNIEQSS